MDLDQGGAPKGNKNGLRGTQWRDALIRATKTHEDDRVKRGQALSAIAAKVVEKALEGDKDSIQEIGNRFDGKPHQSVDVTGYIDTGPKLMLDLRGRDAIEGEVIALALEHDDETTE